MYHTNGNRPLDNNVRLQLPADGRQVSTVPVRAEGNLYYDIVSDIVYVSDGVQWIPIGGSGFNVDLQAAYDNGVPTGNFGTIRDASGRPLFDLSPVFGLRTFQNELGYGTNVVVPVAGIFNMETTYMENQPNRLFLNPGINTDVILPPISADPSVGYPGTYSVGVGYSVTISNQAMVGGADLTVRPTAPDTPNPVVMIPPEFSALIQAVDLGGGLFGWVVGLFSPGGGGGGPVLPTDLQEAYDNGIITGNLGTITDPSGRRLFDLAPLTGLKTFQNELGYGTNIIPVAGIFTMETFFLEDQPNRLFLDPSIATDVILPPIASDPNVGYPGTHSVGVGYSVTISNQAAAGGSDLTVRPTAPDTPDPVVVIPPEFSALIQAVDNGGTFSWVVVMFSSGSSGFGSIVDLQKAYENGTVTGNLGTITDPSGRRLFDLAPLTGLRTFQNQLGLGTSIMPVAGIFTMETFFLEDQPNRLFLNPSIATDVILPPIAADPNVGYPGTHYVGVGYSVTISNQATAGGPNLTVRPTAPDTPDPVVVIPPEYSALMQSVDNGGTFSWVVALFAPGSGGGPVVPTTLQDAYDGTTLAGTQPAIRYDSVGVYGPITIRQPLAGDTVNELMVFEDTTGATIDYLSITQQGLFGRNAVGTGNDVISYGGTNSGTSTDMLILGLQTSVTGSSYGEIIGTSNTLTSGVNSSILGNSNTIASGGTNKFIVGNSNTGVNSGNFTYVFGNSNTGITTTGTNTFVTGTNNTVSGTSSYGTAVGQQNTISAGDYNQVVGQLNSKSGAGFYTTLIGGNNMYSASAGGSLLVGFDNTCSTTASDGGSTGVFLMGNLNSATNSAYYTLAFGRANGSSSATGAHNTLIGSSNTISAGTYGTIFGNNNLVSTAGSNSHVTGTSNTVSNGSYNTIFGNVSSITGTGTHNTIFGGVTANSIAAVGVNSGWNFVQGLNSNVTAAVVHGGNILFGNANNVSSPGTDSGFNFIHGVSNTLSLSTTGNGAGVSTIFGHVNTIGGAGYAVFVQGKSNSVNTFSSSSTAPYIGVFGNLNTIGTTANATGAWLYMFGNANSIQSAGNHKFAVGNSNTLNTTGTNTFVSGTSNSVSAGSYDTIFGSSSIISSTGSHNTIFGGGIGGSGNTIASLGAFSGWNFVQGFSNTVSAAVVQGGNVLLGASNTVSSAGANSGYNFVQGISNTLNSSGTDGSVGINAIFGNNNMILGSGFNSENFVQGLTNNITVSVVHGGNVMHGNNNTISSSGAAAGFNFIQGYNNTLNSTGSVLSIGANAVFGETNAVQGASAGVFVHGRGNSIGTFSAAANSSYTAVFGLLNLIGTTATAIGSYRYLFGTGNAVQTAGDHKFGVGNSNNLNTTGTNTFVSGTSNSVTAGSYGTVFGSSNTISSTGTHNTIFGGITGAANSIASLGANSGYNFVQGVNNSITAAVVHGSSAIFGTANTISSSGVASGYNFSQGYLNTISGTSTLGFIGGNVVFGEQNNILGGAGNLVQGASNNVTAAVVTGGNVIHGSANTVSASGANSGFNVVQGYLNTVSGTGTMTTIASNVVLGETNIVQGISSGVFVHGRNNNVGTFSAASAATHAGTFGLGNTIGTTAASSGSYFYLFGTANSIQSAGNHKYAFGNSNVLNSTGNNNFVAGTSNSISAGSYGTVFGTSNVISSTGQDNTIFGGFPGQPNTIASLGANSGFNFVHGLNNNVTAAVVHGGNFVSGSTNTISSTGANSGFNVVQGYSNTLNSTGTLTTIGGNVIFGETNAVQGMSTGVFVHGRNNNVGTFSAAATSNFTAVFGFANNIATTATAVGLYRYLFGTGNSIQTAGDHKFAIGASNNLNTTGTNAFVTGSSNTVSAGSYVSVFGASNTVTNVSSYGFVFGNSNTVNTTQFMPFVVGTSNSITSTTADGYNTIFGVSNVVSGGYGTFVHGGDTGAFTGGNTVASTGANNFVSGDANTITVNDSHGGNYLFGRSLSYSPSSLVNAGFNLIQGFTNTLSSTGTIGLVGGNVVMGTNHTVSGAGYRHYVLGHSNSVNTFAASSAAITLVHGNSNVIGTTAASAGFYLYLFGSSNAIQTSGNYKFGFGDSNTLSSTGNHITTIGVSNAIGVGTTTTGSHYTLIGSSCTIGSAANVTGSYNTLIGNTNTVSNGATFTSTANHVFLFGATNRLASTTAITSANHIALFGLSNLVNANGDYKLAFGTANTPDNTGGQSYFLGSTNTSSSTGSFLFLLGQSNSSTTSGSNVYLLGASNTTAGNTAVADAWVVGRQSTGQAANTVTLKTSTTNRDYSAAATGVSNATDKLYFASGNGSVLAKGTLPNVSGNVNPWYTKEQNGAATALGTGPVTVHTVNYTSGSQSINGTFFVSSVATSVTTGDSITAIVGFAKSAASQNSATFSSTTAGAPGVTFTVDFTVAGAVSLQVTTTTSAVITHSTCKFHLMMYT